MKVRELIQALSEQPGDREVLVDYQYQNMVFMIHRQKPVDHVEIDPEDGVLLVLKSTCVMDGDMKVSENDDF